MGEAAANLDLAHRIVRVFVEGGVQHAVLSPGSRNTPVVLALVDQAEKGRIQLHNVLDERQAAFLGLGLARGSHAPVILSCTSGTAGAHYLPGIAEASQLGLPLIAITADRPDELQGRGAAQTMDQVGLYGRHVRGAASWSPDGDTLDGDGLERATWQLLMLARGKQAGPVHLNLRFRKPLWDPAWTPSLTEWTPPVPVEQGDKGVELEALQAGVRGAQRGLVIAGPRERSADGKAEAAVLDFARRSAWPVLAEPASGLQGGPLVFGAEAFLRSASAQADLFPDFIVRIGRSPTAKSVSTWLAAVGEGNTCLVEPSGCLLDGERLNPMVVDRPLEEVFSALESSETAPDWPARWREAEARALRCLGVEPEQAIWAGSIVSALWATMGPHEDLHVASSMPIRDLGSFAILQKDGPRVSANRGTNGIDGTIASAVGQARATGRAMTVLLGDLAFLHDQAALTLIGATPVRVIVVDNGGGGIFEYLPIASKQAVFERHFLTPHKADIPAIAQAHGLACQRVENCDSLREAFAHTGPGLVYIPVDRAGDFSRHQVFWDAVSLAMETS
jgi:2-succinyl-5-enolpyruvyl-6-hydroxy-3-cyclohexene-1-carboxylate synthase